MTSEELESIVRKHEMQRLELKESFGIECIETACAFANAAGGFIVIGVDNDGNPSTHQFRGEGLRDYENKIIAQAFFDMGIIERYGSGIKRIKADCDKNGNPYPEWSDLHGEFATTYYPRIANSEQRIQSKEKSKEKGKEKSKEKILAYLSANPDATTDGLVEITGLSISGVEKNIRELKALGRLKRVGADKGGHWEVVASDSI